MRRPSRYHLPDVRPTSFAQVIELTRTKHESAIGYITREGSMKLGPLPADEHQYHAEDRVIVIADE